MHANYSALLTGGEGSRAIFSHAFRVARSRIHPLPLPRTDLLRSPDPNRVDALLGHYPELAQGRPLVFYAPTFRDTPAACARWERELEKLAAAAHTRNVTLVVKTHLREEMRGSTSIPADFLLQNPPLDTSDLLVLCDHVITDYSAVAFEAAVAGKPLWFFTFDLADYRTTRGLNINPHDEMPGSCFDDAETLLDEMLRHPLPGTEQAGFVNRYLKLPPASVSATKQIARLLQTGCSQG
jgi:CDP-ribitol ribitolphosphotransferase